MITRATSNWCIRLVLPLVMSIAWQFCCWLLADLETIYENKSCHLISIDIFDYSRSGVVSKTRVIIYSELSFKGSQPLATTGTVLVI